MIGLFGLTDDETPVKRISSALVDPTSSLAPEQWGAMYKQLWELHERALEENEHLKMQLLFYAGKTAGRA